MELEFLKSLVIIFGVSAIVVFALGRLRIPSVVGFLIAGVILGPHGSGLIEDVHKVELLAEIGVILLMFTIGLEFSLKNLMMLRAQVLGGGLLQVSLTIGAVTLLSYFFFQHALNKAVFNGFLIALSSTAIVMKLLSERGEMSSPQGRMSVGILIFQDLCVIPFVLLVPVLAGNGGGAGEIVLTMLKAFTVVGAVLFAARWAVPQMLHQVVSTRSRELFVITIILLCAGTAYFTFELGLSLALGAFLAGIVISESEYSAQAISDILPFKESFIGLFFISVGMLMDTRFLVSHLLPVGIVVLIILLLKTFTGFLSSLYLKSSLRVSIQSALYLSQIGEFSFVLAVAGKSAGLLSDYVYQIFLSSSVLTMIMTPFVVGVSPALSNRLSSMPFLRRFDRKGGAAEKEKPVRKTDHVIVVGFGVNGRNLARVLRESEIPYVILEMNAHTVQKMKGKGEPIYYGDGTSREILHRLGIDKARMLVIAISDAAATRRIAQTARMEKPDLHIIVRTRYLAEVDDLISLGANEVIPEEFETSVEIFSRVLHQYHVPRNVIADHVDAIRKDSYSVLRSMELPRRNLAERRDILREIETETWLIREGSPVYGHSVKELALRAETGVTIIAVQRGERVEQNPSPDFVLKEGDLIMMIGMRKQINSAVDYLESDRFLVERYHR
ncbi:MAG: hypothetical protein HGA78_03770 [Nitrospirales bacterium]|nr:hypothetical protein [Nitrospirales bacterium]